MRWSAWQKGRVGVQLLSGTSLALAIGCSGEPSVKEELAPMGLDGIEQVEEAAQAARRRPTSYDDRLEFASATSQEATTASGDAPWFLRPAGEAQPGAVIEPPRPQPIANTSPNFSNVSAEQPRPIVNPPPRPVRPINRPGGWRVKAACGRG